YRRFEVDGTGFRELHYRQSGHGFGERADREECLWSDLSAITGGSKPAAVNDLTTLNDRHRNSRNVGVLHLASDKRIDLCGVKRRLPRGHVGAGKHERDGQGKSKKEGGGGEV